MLSKKPRNALFVCVLGACSPPSAGVPSNVPEEPPPSCPQAREQLLSQLRDMPSQRLSLSLRGPLPQAHLSRVFGQGHLLEIRRAQYWLRPNGAVSAATGSAQQLAQALSALPEGVLYLAVDPSVEIEQLRSWIGAAPRRLQLQLLFQEPPAEAAPAVDLPGRLMLEADPDQRTELRAELARALSAPPAHSSAEACAALEPALRSIVEASEGERWPHMQQSLLRTVPQCSCESLDTAGLAHWAVAEQRHGTARLGAIPADFLRDERCAPSLGRQSVSHLLQQIERFDAEFSGQYAQESLDFSEVVNDERLGNYFCGALPGETFASLRRRERPLYWKLPKGASGESVDCQRWEFSPIQPGSPMGTMVRGEGAAAVRLHYWQGAEEVRLFGPLANAEEKATAQRNWPCDTEVKLTGIDPQSIQLTQGRWFYTAEACEEAKPEPAAASSCVVRLALGQTVEPPVASAGESAADEAVTENGAAGTPAPSQPAARQSPVDTSAPPEATTAH